MNFSEWITSAQRRPNLGTFGKAVCLSATLSLSPAAFAGVGMAQLAAGELPFTLLYPTTAESSQHEMGPYVIQVAIDAPVSSERHRLIVMSHGTGGSPLADHALAERMVEAGFVVAMPLHQGDNHSDTADAGPASWRKRPGEVSAVLDYLEDSPEWSAVVDLQRVGVHGMSAGGVTGVALAGGRWRVRQMAEHCTENGTQDEGFCYLGADQGSARFSRTVLYQLGRLAPESALPERTTAWRGGNDPASSSDPRPDPRIAAVTLAVPVGAPFSPESLADITIPVGVVSAARDQVLVPAFHSDYLLKHCRSCTSLAALDKAGHFDVLWPWPEPIARDVASRFPVGGEVHEDFDAAERTEMHGRIVEFMREHL